MKFISVALLSLLSVSIVAAAPREVDYMAKDSYQNLSSMYEKDPELFWKIFNWILIQDTELIDRNHWYTDRIIEGFEQGKLDKCAILSKMLEITEEEFEQHEQQYATKK